MLQSLKLSSPLFFCMRVAVVAGKAVSLINVAKDIAHVAHLKGHAPRILTYVESPVTLSNMSDAVVLVYPSSPLFCAPYMLLYRDLQVLYGTPVVYYTMIEGKIRRYHIADWMRRDLEFVAVSKYTAEKLREAGLRVKGVVYHGLVKEQLAEAAELTQTARRYLQSMFPNKVIFGVLSHSHIRKGLERLAEAASLLAQKRKDFVVYAVTDDVGGKKLADAPCVHVDRVYGKRSRVEMLAFLGAVDFILVPSLAEGFCLPIVEGNAMGTLAVHCMYPPLTEVSSPRVNITFPYDDVEYVNTGDGIEYEMHLYSPKVLASAMEEAMELKLKRRGELEERAEKGKQKARRFDAVKQYTKLLKLIGA